MQALESVMTSPLAIESLRTHTEERRAAKALARSNYLLEDLQVRLDAGTGLFSPMNGPMIMQVLESVMTSPLAIEALRTHTEER